MEADEEKKSFIMGIYGVSEGIGNGGLRGGLGHFVGHLASLLKSKDSHRWRKEHPRQTKGDQLPARCYLIDERGKLSGFSRPVTKRL